MKKKILWLRAETKPHERRTPLIPQHAKKIVQLNHSVYVEKSRTRIFCDDDYLEAGCMLVDANSWQEAPSDAYILGIKELPDSREPLKHHHIYFAHAFKEQEGAKQLLSRFNKGDGLLYDLEFLLDKNNKRVTTFSYWAGVAGCAVTLLLWIKKQTNQALFKIPEYFQNESTLINILEKELDCIKKPNCLIIGANGRCAQGVINILKQFNLKPSLWYREDTKNTLNYPTIFQYDLLFNCVYLTQKIVPFVTIEQLSTQRNLSIIADISCDPNSPFNPLPIYNKVTTFQDPTIKVYGEAHNLDVMAIDHLPTFLPKESSSDFSSQLLPYLIDLLNNASRAEVWNRAAKIFYQHLR